MILSAKIQWNTRLAASNVFDKFEQSVKFFDTIIAQMSEKCDSSNRQ